MSIAIRVISDFNADLFGRYLNAALGPGAAVEVMPFGQVHQSLQQPPAGPEQIAVVWTRAEGAIASFSRADAFEHVSHEEVLAEVDEFAGALLRYAAAVKYLFVPSWVMRPGARGYGMLDYRPGLGVAGLLAKMNVRLAEKLAQASNAYILDAERWMRESGARAAAPKMWYAAKIPYGNSVFQNAAADVTAALDGLQGTSRRLIVLDLDNTLWGGVVGESGWSGIALGGHDHVGEAFVDFQRSLLALNRRGVQLAVVSKNDEDVALAAIDNHPEMVIRRRDLAGWRVNWNDKAQNVAALVAELNLGLASVVFIDDSAIERARVREIFPDVLVPEWPEDPTLYKGALESLRCFDVAALSDEDRRRAGMYAAERERKQTLQGVGSLDEWLATLGIRVEVDVLSDANMKRAAQLFNKTNQMNLATRRLSEAELRAWTADPSRKLWTVSVSDKFGPSGLTGIVSVEIDGNAARLVDFLLSCRVMGRRVEETMLYLAADYAKSCGATSLSARLIPTERNRPCLEFFEKSAMENVGDNEFVISLDGTLEAPECVAIVERETSTP